MATHPLYATYRWRYKTQPEVLGKNPICQRILDDGTQCQHKAEAVHHLVDPKDAPHLAHEWSNLVAVCFGHHAGGQRGETQGAKYCATIGYFESVYYHGIQLLPFTHEKYVPLPSSSVTRISGTTTTAVGASAIDRALGEFA